MSNKIYVGQLPSAITEDDLKSHFASYGEINEINLPTDRKTGQTKGYAFISFAGPESAEAALAENDKELLEQSITVEIAVEKRKKKS